MNVKKILLFFFLFSSVAFGRGRYRPGDWVSWTNFRYVNSVAVSFDHVYFGTTEGILRYDRNRRTYELPLTTSDGLPDNHVRRLAYDRLTDQLYALTTSGSAYFQPVFGEWYASTFPDSLDNNSRPKLPLLFSKDFSLRYLGDGILGDDHFRRFRFSDWVDDGFNNIWIGAWGLGAFRADGRTGELERLPYGLLTSRVGSIFIDGEEVWFACLRKGTETGGLTLWSREEDKWTYYEAGLVTNLNTGQILDITANQNFVYLGTEDGVVRFERKSAYFRPFGRRGGLREEPVLSVLATESGLFAGTRIGVYAVDVKGDSVWNMTSPSISGAVINDLEMAGGYLWAATNRGLYRLGAGGKNWTRFSDSTQIALSTIRSLAVSGDILWAGGLRGLLQIYTANDSTAGYRIPSGAADLDVYALGVNGRLVWAAVRSGVYEFDPVNREWTFLSNLEGLVSNEVFQIVPEGDYVWFATGGGATRYYWNAPHLRK